MRPAHVSAERSGNGAERAENGLSGSGADSGCRKIGLSDERQIGLSRSAHMLRVQHPN